ncbi:FAD-binding protein [candidate division KSB1 bacterium]
MESLKQIEEVVGSDNVVFDHETLSNETENTLGLKKNVLGIVYPGNTDEVQKIVRIANDYLIPLYPVSRGKNIGYGDKLPVSEGQLIIDLKRINRIREYNKTLGYVIVEPGVTQKQLYEHLKANNSNYWMDVTGAGLESSIIGNSLEGGFGHTPKGNRRETISNFEVVLGNSTLLRTGEFPGLGPDISGAFVQSNFGIITSAKLQLMPAPKRFESCIMTAQNNEDIELLIDKLRLLRQRNLITNLIHVANATRSLMTISDFPEGYGDELIDCDKAREILSYKFLKVGYWNAIGGIYGTNNEVRILRKEIRKVMPDNIKIRFFSDSKINLLKSITKHWPFSDKKTKDNIRKNFNSFESVHGLMKGIPSDIPLDNIKWRVETKEQMGLIWFSPTVQAIGKEVRNVVLIAENLFKEYKFEMPVTITLVSQERVVIVFSISFDKMQNEQKQRALQLYAALQKNLSDIGIFPYRSGILSMDNISYLDEGKNETFIQLKKVFDPNNIIAPGRYGIK